jgi:hypothetical protein
MLGLALKLTLQKENKLQHRTNHEEWTVWKSAAKNKKARGWEEADLGWRQSVDLSYLF